MDTGHGHCRNGSPLVGHPWPTSWHMHMARVGPAEAKPICTARPTLSRGSQTGFLRVRTALRLRKPVAQQRGRLRRGHLSRFGASSSVDSLTVRHPKPEEGSQTFSPLCVHTPAVDRPTSMARTSMGELCPQSPGDLPWGLPQG